MNTIALLNAWLVSQSPRLLLTHFWPCRPHHPSALDHRAQPHTPSLSLLVSSFIKIKTYLCISRIKCNFLLYHAQFLTESFLKRSRRIRLGLNLCTYAAIAYSKIMQICEPQGCPLTLNYKKFSHYTRNCKSILTSSLC